MKLKHWAIFINNESRKSELINIVLKGKAPILLENLNELKGSLFSKLAVDKLIDEEARYENNSIPTPNQQRLQTMSSGEQKKALLTHLLKKDLDYIILDNPFDNLDASTQKELRNTLLAKSTETVCIQILSRKHDLLPFINNYAFLQKSKLTVLTDINAFTNINKKEFFTGTLPKPIQRITHANDTLISLTNVTVKFEEKTVLQQINWTIKKGEFWQLIGKNGSGKTTLLSMIIGDNPKGYGQELYLFGQKKGSGESIWDIKQKIGYFTPAMTDKFIGHHSVVNMIISGLNDSIGLYTKPTEHQLHLAKEWLLLINMWSIKNQRFSDLSIGQKRLIMTIRAIIKHPLVLILDEPTAGLDDASATLLTALVNKIAKESEVTIIFVSHRKEPGLEPKSIYELEPTKKGSLGIVK